MFKIDIGYIKLILKIIITTIIIVTIANISVIIVLKNNQNRIVSSC